MMHCKPLIGLNADYRSAGNDTPAYTYVASGYYDCIKEAGGIPVIVPPYEDEADLNCVLDSLQGFVLIGGQDLDPRRDGFMLHPTVRTLDVRREKNDRMLMRLIAERRMPVFGIGVGMQLLNVQQGGNLFLHIPEDLPSRVAPQGPAGPRPSARSGGTRRLAARTRVRRRRDSCQQHAPYGGRRDCGRLQCNRSVPGRSGGGD